MIRPARLEDLADLAAMIAALARHHGDVPRLDPAQLAADLFTAVPWVHALLAEAEGGVLGYALLGRLYRAQFGMRGMELLHLYVAPEARGQGLGRGLVAAAVERAWALGCRYFTIGTQAQNAEAQRFYAGLGFEPAPPPGPRFRLALD